MNLPVRGAPADGKKPPLYVLPLPFLIPSRLVLQKNKWQDPSGRTNYLKPNILAREFQQKRSIQFQTKMNPNSHNAQLEVFSRIAALSVILGRVDPDCYPLRPPTDPDVRNCCIRLFKS